MARYRLREAHYLQVPGTEWEQKETDQASGRQVRKVYPVPLLLDPKNTADCNYPGEVIVANKPSREHPRDIIFTGPPTPDMEPLDEEAEAELAKRNWVHPIDSLPAEGGHGALLMVDLQRQIADLQSRDQPGVIADLQRQVAELTALVKQARRA